MMMMMMITDFMQTKRSSQGRGFIWLTDI